MRATASACKVGLMRRDKPLNRNRHLFLGILSSGVNKGVAALAPLITVPVALQFLGVPAYGAWTAALALTAFAAFADLGIGAGLMTKLSAALASGDTSQAGRLVSSAYLALTALVVVVVSALWLSALFIDWAQVTGGAPARGDQQIAMVTLITLSAFFVNVLAMLIVRVQYAAQQVPLSNFWQAAGGLLGIVAIYVAAAVAPGIPEFVAIAAFTPGVISLINTLQFFSLGRGSGYRPNIRRFRARETKVLAGIGVRFLTINILMAVALGTDSWIVAHTISLDAVPEYAVPARVFAVIGTLVSVLTIPLWPANAAALSTGDFGWVERTTRRMAVVTPLLVASLSVVAVVVAPFAFGWWLGEIIVPSFLLLVGLALWNTVQAFVAPIFMVQNALGVLRPQLLGYIGLLVVLFPLKWFIAARFGYEWLPLVTSICYVALIWPAALLGYRQSMRQARNQTKIALSSNFAD